MIINSGSMTVFSASIRAASSGSSAAVTTSIVVLAVEAQASAPVEADADWQQLSEAVAEGSATIGSPSALAAVSEQHPVAGTIGMVSDSAVIIGVSQKSRHRELGLQK